jgi:hypothetical protein
MYAVCIVVGYFFVACFEFIFAFAFVFVLIVVCWVQKRILVKFLIYQTNRVGNEFEDSCYLC